MKPRRISIRTYQVGFGDCFLVSFRYAADDERHVLIDFGTTALPKDAPKSRMADIAADIARRTGGKLTAVVATHRHQDHVSGFARGSRDSGTGVTIANLKPDLVLQPWTEDPDLPTDAAAPARRTGGASTRGMRAHAITLRAMQEVAGQILQEVKRNRYLTNELRGLREAINFLGEDNLGNADAVRNLMSMAPNEYLHYGKSTSLETLLPGVVVDVLGPPTVAQHDEVRSQRRRDEDEFWHLYRAAAGSLAPAPRGRVTPLFPDHVRKGARSRLPIESRWLAYHAKRMRAEQMLSIVRMLDRAMNNTSLILMFRIGRTSLLFPGDAQIENWEYALSRKSKMRLLRGIDVYKVGHHGSLNATPKSLWENFANRTTDKTVKRRMRTLMSTMADKHGTPGKSTEVPRRTLTAALRRDTTLLSTEDLTGDDYYEDTVLDL